MSNVFTNAGASEDSTIGKRVKILPSSLKAWAVGKTGTIINVIEDLNPTDVDPFFHVMIFDVLLDDMDKTKPPFGKYSFHADEFGFISEEPEKKEDMVNHPSHYTDGKYEVIDFIESTGLYQDFYAANAVKYICRAGKKNPDKEKEDLEKAVWYLERGKDWELKGIVEAGNRIWDYNANRHIRVDAFIEDKGLTGTLRGIAIKMITRAAKTKADRSANHQDAIDILKVEIKNMEVNEK